MILNIVLPVFLVIIVSFIFGKLKRININPVVDVTVYLTVPCLIFYSIVESEFVVGEFFILFFAVAAVLLLSGLLAYVWFRMFKIEKKGFYLPLMFPNTGNMGFPIVLLAFGMAGLAKAVIYSTFTSLFLFSLGVYIVAKKANFKEIFKLPLIYAVILGILFAVFKIKLPEVIMNPVKLLGDAAIPLQLIILGYSLSFVRLNHLRLAVQGALFRFITGFLIALGFVSVLGVTGLTRNVILLQSIMPSALFCIILSQKYNRDSALVASTVFASTLLSIAFIPLVLGYIQ